MTIKKTEMMSKMKMKKMMMNTKRVKEPKKRKKMNMMKTNTKRMKM